MGQHLCFGCNGSGTMSVTRGGIRYVSPCVMIDCRDGIIRNCRSC
jgi:hypothetical protein